LENKQAQFLKVLESPKFASQVSGFLLRVGLSKVFGVSNTPFLLFERSDARRRIIFLNKGKDLISLF